MTPLGIIRLNVKIIRVLNSCDRKDFEALINEVIDQPNVFRKKYFIWNIVRGRDFYKMLAYYVIQQIEQQVLDDNESHDDDVSYVGNHHINQAETIIHMVMETAKTETIKKNFIWAIMKQVPILTTTTVQYASAEKIRSILKSGKTIVMDSSIKPFIDEVVELRQTIVEQEERIQVLETMMD